MEVLGEIFNINLGLFYVYLLRCAIPNLTNYLTKNGLLKKELERRNNIDLLYLFNSSILSMCALFYLFGDYGYNYFDLIKYYNLGYLITDIYMMFTVDECKKNKYIFTFHHLIFLIGWFYGNQNRQIFARLLLAEINVVTFNLRFIMKKNGYKYYDIFSVFTYILFFIFRVLNFTDFVLDKQYELLIKGKTFLLYPIILLQYYWFILLTHRAYYLVYKKEIKID